MLGAQERAAQAQGPRAGGLGRAWAHPLPAAVLSGLGPALRQRCARPRGHKEQGQVPARLLGLAFLGTNDCEGPTQRGPGAACGAPCGLMLCSSRSGVLPGDGLGLRGRTGHSTGPGIQPSGGGGTGRRDRAGERGGGRSGGRRRNRGAGALGQDLRGQEPVSSSDASALRGPGDPPLDPGS